MRTNANAPSPDCALNAGLSEAFRSRKQKGRPRSSEQVPVPQKNPHHDLRRWPNCFSAERARATLEQVWYRIIDVSPSHRHEVAAILTPRVTVNEF
jgi:hypothetical protein